MVLIGTGVTAVATDHVASGTAALVQASAPAWMVLAERVLLRRRPGPRVAVGLGVAALGIGLLVRTAISGGLEWIVLLLVSTVCWVLGGLIASTTAIRDTGVGGTGVQMSFGGVLVIVAALFHGDLGTMAHASIYARAIAAWFFLLVVSALIGFATYMWLLGNSRSVVANSFCFVAPVVALLAGWLLLGEHTGPATLFAAAVVLSGVVLMMMGASNTGAHPLDLESQIALESEIATGEFT
jgi:drug/metabolite transporter (DMT)-like permease